MASYGYEAIDKVGRATKGSIEADTIEIARAMIKAKDLVIIDIKEQSLLTKDVNINIGGYPKARDLSVFCSQFVSMLRAGVAIIEALKLLEEQTECVKLKEATKKVRNDVETGETLADSIAKHPKVFPELMVNLVRSGEASGSLDTALSRMGLQFEKTARTKALIKKAMIYPIMVGIVAVALIVIMLVVVIPKYEVMFKDLGTDLPGITVAMVNASNFLTTYWFIVVPAIIGIVILIRIWSKTDSGKHVLHKFTLKFPISKKLVTKKSSALMARTLSTLLGAGVPLLEATEIVSTTMENVYFKEALEMAHEEVMIGQPLSIPLEDAGIFPPMVYHMVRIGEESGNVEEMLDKLAEYYEEEVEMEVQSMMAALEPIIIIVLAGIVGTLVAACFAPMLKMYSALDGL